MIDLNINKIKAKPGEKAFGFLETGTSSIVTYNIPVAIINGVEEGKTLGVIGGNHGTEFTGIEAIIRVIQDLNPREMKGALIAVPVLNGPQFEHRHPYVNPIDHMNQNAVFPGRQDGTLSRRTAHIVFSEVVSKCDALIDCHGGDINEDFHGFIIVKEIRDKELYRASLEMAHCFPTNYIKVVPEAEARAGGGLTMNAIEAYRIPSVVSESGTPYPVREGQVRFHYDGIMNNLRYFGILKGQPRMAEPVINPKCYRFKARQGGIWHSYVELGQKVSEGEVVGNVTDTFGNLLEIFKAPEDSVVDFLRTYYSVNCGETLIWLVVQE